MIPYYIMVGVPIVFYLLYGGTNQYFNNEKKQRITIFLFFAIAFVLLALRDKSVGVDLSAYLPNFNVVKKLSFEQLFDKFERERGFWILNKIISLFTGEEQVFLIIMALITVIPVAKLYIKESENALLSIAIFLIMPNFAMMFSGLRQAVAISLVAIAFKYVKEKKLIKFILIILLAITFHKSAFIAFLIYPFYHMNITKGKLFAIIPAIIAILVFNKPIFEFLLEFMGEYGEKYEYEETTAYTMIILFALFFVFSYFAPDEKQMDKNAMGLRNIGVLALTLQIFALANPVAMRMNYYVIIFLPLLLPKVINRVHERNKQFYQFIGLIIAIFFFVYYIYNTNTGEDILELYPYKAFWQ